MNLGIVGFQSQSSVAERALGIAMRYVILIELIAAKRSATEKSPSRCKANEPSRGFLAALLQNSSPAQNDKKKGGGVLNDRKKPFLQAWVRSLWLIRRNSGAVTHSKEICR